MRFPIQIWLELKNVDNKLTIRIIINNKIPKYFSQFSSKNHSDNSKIKNGNVN